MNFRSIMLSATAAVAIVASTFSPSLAMQPVPTNHLVAAHLNPKAQLAGGANYSDLGTLQAGQYAVVTPSGIINGGATTITFVSADRSVTALVKNGVPTLINFGHSVGGDNNLVATWYYGNQQTNITLDIWSPSLAQ